jgi:hypothetical protein
MILRARFRVHKFETRRINRKIDPATEATAENLETVEVANVTLRAVDPGDDPSHPNAGFWKENPDGEITLTMINPEAWQEFQLDKEYNVRFSVVE